jgi:hypothetical protein
MTVTSFIRQRKAWVLGALIVMAGLGVAASRAAAAVPDMNTVSRLNGYSPYLVQPSWTTVRGAGTVDSTEQLALTPVPVLNVAPTVSEVGDKVNQEVAQLCSKVIFCVNPPPAAPVASPVAVTVDGTSIGPVAIATAAGSAMVSALTNGESIDWTTAYQRGVSTAVLRHLLWVAAQQDGTAVTDAVAQAYAQQQLDKYLSDSSPNRPTIAAGETAQEVFAGSSVVSADKVHLSINAERTAIATREFGSAFTPDQEDYALRAWFETIAPSHQVIVSGIPAFDLASTLPAGHPY